MLEDMLRACVLDHKGSWEEHLPLVEFAHNDNYQASIQNLGTKFLLRGGECKTRGNSNFRKNGKIVILVKI